MTVLLDVNVLIALLVTDHVHHDAAELWFGAMSEHFATCPITEGSLIRLLLREGQTSESAKSIVAALEDHPDHEFWSDDISYQKLSMHGIISHRQVTDAYLAELTRVHHGLLATFDQGLAELHHDVATLVPVRGQKSAGA